MMSVFSRAGVGIQNILSEWRQPAKTLSVFAFAMTALPKGELLMLRSAFSFRPELSHCAKSSPSRGSWLRMQ